MELTAEQVRETVGMILRILVRRSEGEIRIAEGEYNEALGDGRKLCAEEDLKTGDLVLKLTDE